MALVLAIEPDLRQAAILKRIVREQVRADVVVVDSRDDALQAIRSAVPDVVLLSALLSPRDEDELFAHLRGLQGADHLQTHTIPQLASSLADGEESGGGGGFLKAFRRKKKAPAQPVAGCDPDLFAEEIRTFLRQAEERRRERVEERQFQEQQSADGAPSRIVSPGLAASSVAEAAEPDASSSASWSSPFEWRPREKAAAPASYAEAEAPGGLAESVLANESEDAVEPSVLTQPEPVATEAFDAVAHYETQRAEAATDEIVAGQMPDDSHAAPAAYDSLHVEAQPGEAPVTAADHADDLIFATEPPVAEAAAIAVYPERDEPLLDAATAAPDPIAIGEDQIAAAAEHSSEPVEPELPTPAPASWPDPPALEPAVFGVSATPDMPIVIERFETAQPVIEPVEAELELADAIAAESMSAPAFVAADLMATPEAVADPGQPAETPVYELDAIADAAELFTPAPAASAAPAVTYDFGAETVETAVVEPEPVASVVAEPEPEAAVELAPPAAEPARPVVKLGPLATWARLETAGGNGTKEIAGSDLRALIGSLAVPPHVAGVTYARGVRIRRVRVPAAPTRRGRTAKVTGPVILSRRALESQRTAAV